MVIKKIKDKIPSTKPLITPKLAETLDPSKYCIINYVETFRRIDKKPMWLGRDWASLRAYQMFCHIDPETGIPDIKDEDYIDKKTGLVDESLKREKYPDAKPCSYNIDNNNICGYNRSSTCGCAWKVKDFTIRKSAQSRWSEFFLSLACFWADVFHWTIGYYMPSQEHLNKWTPERVMKGCIQSTPRYKKLCTERKEYIIFDDTYFYLFGLHTTPMTFTINAAFIDEIAEVKNLANVTSVKARMLDKSKDEKFILKYSTPKFAGRDICEEYEKGNQLRWHIECDNCSSLEKISFTTHIDKEKEIIKCLKCGSAINRLKDGIWLPDKPENTPISMQYEYIYTEPAIVKGMLEEMESDRIDIVTPFYWHKLGLPYTPEGSEITEDMIRKCPRYEFGKVRESGTIRTAGVDVGNAVFDVRISDQYQGIKKALFMGTIPLPEENKVHGKIMWAQLGYLLFDVFKCDIVVIDNLPRDKLAKEFARHYAGKVYRWVNTDGRIEPIWHHKIEKDLDKRYQVNVARDTILDQVQLQIAHKKIEYPNEFFTHKNKRIHTVMVEDYQRYIDHLTALHKASVPIEQKIGTGSKKIVITTENVITWTEKKSGGDHLFLAEAYDSLAGMIPIAKTKVIPVKVMKNRELEKLYQAKESLKRILEGS